MASDAAVIATLLAAPLDGVSPSVLLAVAGPDRAPAAQVSCPCCPPRTLAIVLIDMRDVTITLALLIMLCTALFLWTLQYLFNVPEGFARLVLEHRIRPGAGLRAAFATDVQPTSVVRVHSSRARFSCVPGHYHTQTDSQSGENRIRSQQCPTSRSTDGQACDTNHASWAFHCPCSSPAPPQY